MNTPSRMRWVCRVTGVVLGGLLVTSLGWSRALSGRFCRLDTFTHIDRQMGPRGRLETQGQSQAMALALSFVDTESLPYSQARQGLEVASEKHRLAQWEWQEAQRRHRGTGDAPVEASLKTLRLAAAHLQPVGEQLLSDTTWKLPELSDHTKLYEVMSAVESRIAALHQVLLERQKTEGPTLIFEKHVRPYLLPMLEHLQGRPVSQDQLDVIVDPRSGYHHVIVRGVWLKQDAQKVLEGFNIFVFPEDLFSKAQEELRSARVPEGSATTGAFVQGALRFHFEGTLPYGVNSPGTMQAYVRSKFYEPRLLPLLRFFEAKGWLVNHIKPEFQAQTGKIYFDVPEPRPMAPDQRIVVLDVSIRSDALEFLKRHFRVEVENAKTVRLQSGYYVPSSRPKDPYGNDARILELRKFLPGGDGGKMTTELYREFHTWLERKLRWEALQARFDRQEGGIEVELETLGGGLGYRLIYKFVKTSYSSQNTYPRNLTDEEIQWFREFLAFEFEKRKSEIDRGAAQAQGKNPWGY